MKKDVKNDRPDIDEVRWILRKCVRRVKKKEGTVSKMPTKNKGDPYYDGFFNTDRVKVHISSNTAVSVVSKKW